MADASQDTTTSGTDRSLIVRTSLVVLTLAALFVGATAVGGRSRTVDLDAGERILSYYQDEEEGASRLLDAVVDETLPDRSRAELEEVLTGFLRSDVEVVAQDAFRVARVEVAVVDTSDGARWCIRPDGKILLGCLLGRVPVTAQPDDPRIIVDTAEVLVAPDRVRFDLQLTTTGDTIRLAGVPAVVDETGSPVDWPAVEAGYLFGDVGQQAPLRDVDLGAEALYVVRYQLPDVASAVELNGSRLRWQWDDGGIDLRVGTVDWFLR